MASTNLNRWVESRLDAGDAHDVRRLLDSDQYLYSCITEHLQIGRDTLSSLSQAAKLLVHIRETLQLSPSVRLSAIWTRAASGELLGSPLLRETMLLLKKTPSDKLVQLLASLQGLGEAAAPIDYEAFQQDLSMLVEENESSIPLRSQDDVRNSLRTTVVAQKVLLSKHKANLSEQEKAYSELVTRFHDEVDGYFNSSFVDPRTLLLSEILLHDLKSPHTEVFQPKPRFAIERALSSPHDYLGCDCCNTKQEGENALAATQPATAILYQLYLESGALINASDLWSAFNAIVGEDDEESESKTM